eukprot:CAMPEP_0206331496 /NCGR_PEP_ID=MMETSP0106_2-20121207/24276_1 /ASSEMBLY_ACC=CAM_ASM_000206 /TAXON_ID=81532 /ORGANISM="Acanthoeca-like sp., Strain 10tr" /LENGTH=70 /DNA_ID=CAMNT_0053764311 /DNA_START=285 /DNA_END=493 /DNA_ORIENTATION=+
MNKRLCGMVKPPRCVALRVMDIGKHLVVRLGHVGCCELTCFQRHPRRQLDGPENGVGAVYQLRVGNPHQR